MERKLASIQKVIKVEPIPNADRIEKLTVLGWEIVSQKGLHKEGDLVVYIEIDSIVPDIPEFDFMAQRNFRVRTIKLRKQVSQGLVVPLSILPKKNWKEGDDVTELLGVTKYLTPTERRERERENISNNRITKFMKRYKWYRRLFPTKRKKGFPRFIRKTDEDRIQLFPEICETLKNKALYVSEKLDGSSATYALIKIKKFFGLISDYEFIVCSRNIHLKRKDPNNNYWKIAIKYDIETYLRRKIGSKPFIILQGEIIGPTIQKNKYKLEEIDFYAFNLIEYPYNYVDPIEVRTSLILNGIKHVPIISTKYFLKDTIQEVIEDTQIKSIINKDVWVEGWVFRRYEDNISFKAINPKFLLKYDE